MTNPTEIALYALSLGLAFVITNRRVSGPLVRWARASYEFTRGGHGARLDLPDGDRLFGQYKDRPWQIDAMESFDSRERRRVVVHIAWSSALPWGERLDLSTHLAQVIQQRMSVHAVAIAWRSPAHQTGCLIFAPDARGWMGTHLAPLVAAVEGEFEHTAAIVSAFGDAPAQGLFVPPLPTFEARQTPASA
jgi:hypothetical protein